MIWTFRGSKPGRDKTVSLLQKPTLPVLEPTKASNSMGTGFFSVRGPSVKLITHLHLVSRSRMTVVTNLFLLYTENFLMTTTLLLYIFQKYYNSTSFVFFNDVSRYTI
jgi:hypothetical protein